MLVSLQQGWGQDEWETQDLSTQNPLLGAHALHGV